MKVQHIGDQLLLAGLHPEHGGKQHDVAVAILDIGTNHGH
jgi:hypothetical protein